MTEEGRLARGKLNYEAKRFPDNQETLDYVKTLPKEPEVPKETKSKEKKK